MAALFAIADADQAAPGVEASRESFKRGKRFSFHLRSSATALLVFGRDSQSLSMFHFPGCMTKLRPRPEASQ